MNELIKGYIGKDVIIYTSTSTVGGILKKIEDNWIEVETSAGNRLVNTDYISRIEEFTRNKKGKKSPIRALFFK